LEEVNTDVSDMCVNMIIEYDYVCVD